MEYDSGQPFWLPPTVRFFRKIRHKIRVLWRYSQNELRPFIYGHMRQRLFVIPVPFFMFKLYFRSNFWPVVYFPVLIYLLNKIVK